MSCLLHPPQALKVELILDAKASLGEGLCWDARKAVLYWVDILAHEVHIFDPSIPADSNQPQDQVIDVGQYVGAVVPRKSDGLLLAVHHGFAILDLKTEKLKIINDPESHLPNNRFNDGKCDPAGRFWAGTLDLGAKPAAGSLYCMDTDQTVRKALDNVTISNGLAWSLDHSTMYFIDTPTKQLSAYDYDIDTGHIGNQRVVITFPKNMGHPDGMTIDTEGMLWVALYGGSCVSRWDPSNGKLIQKISVPATNVTNCTFGGPSLDRLYITTAREGLDEAALGQQPHAGGLFCATPGVSGLPAVEFG